MESASSQPIADLVRTVGTEEFPAALANALGAALAFDSMIVTGYEADSAPHPLHHDLDEVQATIHIDFYNAGPYRLDPFYLAAMCDGVTGVRRLSDLVGPSFYKSEYYRMFYRKIGLIDELDLIVPDGNSRRILVSLARKLRRPRFSDTDAGAAAAVYPIVAAGVRRQWGKETGAEESVAQLTGLADFTSDVLSPRELQIIRLVLEGYSTPSAAALLGIAEGTVKVHRRQAYAKLGVASQGELFRKAAAQLSQPRD